MTLADSPSFLRGSEQGSLVDKLFELIGLEFTKKPLMDGMFFR